jgi:hypothetical protein
VPIDTFAAQQSDKFIGYAQSAGNCPIMLRNPYTHHIFINLCFCFALSKGKSKK